MNRRLKISRKRLRWRKSSKGIVAILREFERKAMLPVPESDLILWMEKVFASKKKVKLDTRSKLKIRSPNKRTTFICK